MCPFIDLRVWTVPADITRAVEAWLADAIIGALGWDAGYVRAVVAPFEDTVAYLRFVRDACGGAALRFPRIGGAGWMTLGESLVGAAHFLRTRTVLVAREAGGWRPAYDRWATAFLRAHAPVADAVAADPGVDPRAVAEFVRLVPGADDWHRIDVHTRFFQRAPFPRAGLTGAGAPDDARRRIVLAEFTDAVAVFRAQPAAWRAAAASSVAGAAHCVLGPGTHAVYAVALLRCTDAAAPGAEDGYTAATYVATHLPLLAWAADSGAGAAASADAVLEAAPAAAPDLPLTVLDTVYPHDGACPHEGSLPKHGAGYAFVDLFHDRGMKGARFPWHHLNSKLTRKVCQARKLPQVLEQHARGDAAFLRFLVGVAETALLGLYRHARVRPSLANAVAIHRFVCAARRGRGGGAEFGAALGAPNNVFVAALREHLAWGLRTQIPVLCRLLADVGWNDLEDSAFASMDRLRALDLRTLVAGTPVVARCLTFSWDHPVVYRTQSADFIASLHKTLAHSARVGAGAGAGAPAPAPAVAVAHARELARFVAGLDVHAMIDVTPLRFFGATPATLAAFMRLQDMFIVDASMQEMRAEVDAIPADQLAIVRFFVKCVADFQAISVTEIADAPFVAMQLRALCRLYRVRAAADLPPGAGELVVTPATRRVNCPVASQGQVEKYGTDMIYLDIFSGQLHEVVHPGMEAGEVHDAVSIQGVGRIIELAGFSGRGSAKDVDAGGARPRPRSRAHAHARKSSMRVGPRAHVAAARAGLSSYVHAPTKSPRNTMALIIAPCCGQWARFNVAHCTSAAPFYQCGHCDPAGAYNEVAPRCGMCHVNVVAAPAADGAPGGAAGDDGLAWQCVDLAQRTDDGLYRIVPTNVCPMCQHAHVNSLSLPQFDADYRRALGDRLFAHTLTHIPS